ncbi:MAG: FAD-dependent oxidoreductase, partial [Polyangiaceae bacterium]
MKVAILGGGMAGVAAAWTLVHDPPPGVTFDVTLYESSWRLGGKCASGRKVADGSYRIEEHGIHILLGFYSQVLRILRDCYAEVQPMGLGFPTFAQALEPSDLLQIPDEINGAWDFWPITFPPNAQHPGDADPDQRDFLGSIVKAAEALAGWVQQYEAQVASGTTLGATLGAALPGLGSSPAATVTDLLQLPAILQGILASPPGAAGLSTTLRHLWMAIYFAATNLLGILEWGLFTPAAFQNPTLNAMDYKDWLKSIGPALPSPELTWDSPIVNAIYDLCFSRDVKFAAGVALYDSLMMLLLYAGHIFYRMAGTGDVVFAPLYFALAGKGVHFRFEHTITDVHVGPPGPTGPPVVDRIELTGDGLERPVAELFANPSGQYWWPDAPLFAPVVGPMTLVQGIDFDHVICAIPLGALRSSAPSLAALTPISAAIGGMTTVPTQSIQLWLDDTAANLGWAGGRMMLGSFERPFNSCADMAQALPTERFPGEKAVLYMSDVYTGATPNPNAALQIVRSDAIAWVNTSLPKLLPAFDWNHLVDPSGATGSDRIDAQYLRANVAGTELYVASSPGSVALRLPADGAGLANLFLASDWVITEENQGCVEGAARSGVSAARACSLRAGLPAYVQNDDDWVFPGPVVLADATAQAFPFLASPAALAALCARHSLPGATLTPWTSTIPLVIVFACASDDITSADPTYRTWGKLSERELGVFVPVKVQTATSTSVALLCPYLFVDNGATLVAGREIYGIPKELAVLPPWLVGAGVPFPLSATS